MPGGGKGTALRDQPSRRLGGLLPHAEPVIHNDYANLAHKKGLPEGHAPFVRDLGVPVLRDDRVVAIIGVGNKATDYTQDDVLVLQSLAVPLMDLVGYRRANEATRQAKEDWEQTFNTVPDFVAILDDQHRIVAPTGPWPSDWA